MADENKVDKGLSAHGARPQDASEGQGLGGAHKAPPVENKAPDKKEGLDEVHGADDAAKAAAEVAKAKEAEEAKAKADAEAAAKAKEGTEDAAKPVDVAEYVQLDDPAGQAAIELMAEAGVTPTEANAIFAKALETQDLKDVDVAALEAKIGKAKAKLVMVGVTDFYNRQTEKNKATTKLVFDVIGGEQNWNTVKTWANEQEKSDPAFKLRLDQVREMIDKGGFYAETGTKELMRLYEADPKTKGLGTVQNPVQRGDKLNNSVGAPLSRNDYLAARKEAENRGASAAEIKALHARREAGRAAGI